MARGVAARARSQAVLTDTQVQTQAQALVAAMSAFAPERADIMEAQQEQLRYNRPHITVNASH